MDVITTKEIANLLKLPGKPCVSFYQPTQPGGAAKDPIQFKNLIAEAEGKLLKLMDEDAVKKMLRPARHLLDDRDFWKNSREGLAFFLSPEVQRSYRLRQAFGPRVMVGARFFVKPLLGLVDAAPHYYVLALNQKHIRLWEGDANTLREVELKAMPTSLAEALQLDEREETLSQRTIHGGSNASAAFSYGVGLDTAKDDLLLYFQKIDRGLHEYLPANAPLILAGVEYLWPIYRRANRHAHLLEHGIPGNAERWSAQELHERSWNLVRDRHERPRRQACERFAALAGTGRTCSDPPEVIRAACAGRLETLMVALDREAWGQWDAVKNEATLHPQPSDGDEDLLNLAALNAAAHGAKVFVMPGRQMPLGSVIAGIYWTPPAKHG